jgi:hypothetical protein
MDPPDFICSKCGGAMEVGMIADQSYGAALQSRWFEGNAKETLWSGLKTDGEAVYPVTTYRCKDCSYLESYALKENARQKSIFE